jgi:hypothetical protein
MVRESDGIFSECTDPSIMEWVLSILGSHQRPMTNLRGQAGKGLEADPSSWRHWLRKGCDFFGYAWGTPPDFPPHPKFADDVAVVREAFQKI